MGSQNGSGGRQGFLLGGRGGRGQRAYQGSATYTFGGSILDSPPFQLRRDVPATQPQFAQNTVGGTFGGFLKVPGLYANADRRTNVQVNYTANRTSNVFDQYATVPTDAERSGNFSSSAIQLIDPASGRPFPGNQIPASRIDPGAATLMRFIPRSNLPGTTQNYHLSTTAHSSSEALTLRVTQNFSRTAGQGSSGPGRSSGGPGPGRGTNVVLNAQVDRQPVRAAVLLVDL